MFRVSSRLLRTMTLSSKRLPCISASYAQQAPLIARTFSSSCNHYSSCSSKCMDSCKSCHKHSQCWNCHHFTDCNERFCPECHKIQPVYSLEEGGCNYFQLFGIPETYDIDLKKLELNFRNLQKVLHPDLYSTKSDEEKAVSANVSSTINIAHNKLKDPITRAAYLVKLLTGAEVLGEESNFKVPMDILMEVMEIREQVSGAKSKEAKADVRKQVVNGFKKHEDAFRCGLCKKDQNSLCNEAVAMKYYDSILKEMDN